MGFIATEVALANDVGVPRAALEAGAGGSHGFLPLGLAPLRFAASSPSMSRLLAQKASPICKSDERGRIGQITAIHS